MSNPWIGLKTYEEGQIIYGRTDDINALSSSILFNVQTVIYGKSGIGKSSILNAGIFPILRRSNFFPAKIRLVHNDPHNSYTKQIRKCVLSSLFHLRKEYIDSDGVLKTRETRGRYEKLSVRHNYEQEESLWEFFHRHLFYDEKGTRIQPVLVLDQFEEIFTLEKKPERVTAFFGELADLINNIAPDYLCDNVSADAGQIPMKDVDRKVSSVNDELIDEEYSPSLTKYFTDSNFHIVLSLREDFLSHLERNIYNIPLLKHNRYCLRPLSDDQAASIIMDPCPGLVSKDVAKEIICKVTGAKFTDFEIDDTPELEVDSAILSLFLTEIYEKKQPGDKFVSSSLVKELGDNIISGFYERTVQQVSSKCIEYLERRLVTEEGRRDSIFETRALNKGIFREELQILEEQRLIRRFSWNNEMRIEFMHDILCPIVKQRREERNGRRQLEEEQRKKEDEQRKKISEAQEKAEELRRRNKQLLMGIAGILLAVIAAVLLIWDGWFRDIDTRYGIIVKQYGCFKGLEVLSKEEASYRSYHYVLKRKGRWSNHPYLMEARDGYGKLTGNHSMGAYILNQYDYTDKGADNEMMEKLKAICQWEMVYNQEGNFVIQELAKDKEGNLVFAYNRTQTDEPNKVISTYADEYGFPIILRDSCYFYLRTTYDTRGFEVLMEFFDDDGNPITNKDGAFQTTRTYLDNGIVNSEFSLFLNGHRMIDRFGNCGWIKTSYTDDSLRELASVSLDADSIPCRTTLDSKTIVKRWVYDKHGRVKTETYWDENGKPDKDAHGSYGYEYEYNRHGQIIHAYRVDDKGNRCKDSEGYFDWHREYDKHGNNIVSEMIAQDSIKNGYRYKYSDEGILLEQDNYDVAGGDTTYTYKYRKDEMQRKISRYIAGDCWIREELDEKDNQISWAYYDTLNLSPVNRYGYHIEKTDYEYGDRVTRYTISYYDKEGQRCCTEDNNWSYAIYVVDSVKNACSVIRYDSLGNFYDGYKNVFTNDFIKKISEESLDERGNTRRTYKNGAFYFKENIIFPVKPTFSKKHVGWYGVNEFEEPSLVKWYSDLYHCYYKQKGRELYFNEVGKQIDPSNVQYPLLGYIELLGSDEKLGFKDGDIVLKCNDWIMEFDDEDPMKPFRNTPWWNAKERIFYVARFAAEKQIYEIVKVVVDGAVDIDKYLSFKRLYCTNKEKERIEILVKDAFYKSYIMVEPGDTTSVVYRAGLHQRTFLFEYNDWNCLKEIDSTTIATIIEDNRKKVKRIAFLDFDSLKVKELILEYDTLGMYMTRRKLSPDDFDTFLTFYLRWKKDMSK